jgi:hypothetical protein
MHMPSDGRQARPGPQTVSAQVSATHSPELGSQMRPAAQLTPLHGSATHMPSTQR